MKALVLEQYKHLVVRDLPRPVPGPGEVLVQVRACGICGSDIHGMDGSTGRRIPPLIMGHEAAGEIAATHPSVSRWKTGDRVTFDSTIYCGNCWHCRRGEVNLCEQREVLGVSCGDYRRNGAFADFVVVPERILYALPPQLSFEQAAMVEAVSVAVHAVARTPGVRGSSAVVIGAGMIGLLIIQVLKDAGARQIIAADLSETRLELARKLGATATINSSAKDIIESIRALTDGRGADVVFEVVGLGTTIQLAVDAARKGASVTLVGNLEPRVTLPLQTVVTRQLTLIGTCASAGEYPQCLELIASGKVNVTDFISAVAPLSEGPEWFDRLYAGKSNLMKVLLVP